jgi:hypothetical protein
MCPTTPMLVRGEEVHTHTSSAALPCIARVVLESSSKPVLWKTNFLFGALVWHVRVNKCVHAYHVPSSETLSLALHVGSIGVRRLHLARYMEARQITDHVWVFHSHICLSHSSCVPFGDISSRLPHLSGCPHSSPRAKGIPMQSLFPETACT